MPWNGVPKPILKAYSTQTISTTANAANVSIMLLIDQRFCITPPYSTTSPGTLISPTSVAAVICQAVSPGLSHVGYGSHIRWDLLVLDGNWNRVAAAPQRHGPRRPSQTRTVSPAARRRHHGLASSKREPRLDIGINALRQGMIGAPRGSTSTEPRAESSIDRVGSAERDPAPASRSACEPTTIRSASGSSADGHLGPERLRECGGRSLRGSSSSAAAAAIVRIAPRPCARSPARRRPIATEPPWSSCCAGRPAPPVRAGCGSPSRTRSARRPRPRRA